MKLFKRAFVNPPAARVLPPPRSQVDINSAAIRISSVYRSVSILATAASQMTGNVKRGSTVLPKPTWVAQPDPQISGPAFTEETVTAMALTGNAYWRIYRNGRDEVIALKNLNPHEVEIEIRADGKVLYHFGGRVFNENEIKHLQLLRLPGQTKGIGPIQSARYSLEANLALQSFQNEWFSNPVPPVYLKTDQALSPSLADQYESRWQEKLNEKRTPILGSGLELKSILLTPKDALFIEVANYSVLEVSRIFGIPSHFLNAGVEGNSLTYANVSDLDRHFIRYTLAQYLLEMEGALNALLPRGQKYEFDAKTLLSLNTKERYETYEVALRSGWMTKDEIRELENLAPLPQTAIEPPKENEDDSTQHDTP